MKKEGVNSISTIKLSKKTKDKLINLDFSKKNMSFENIIKELINFYNKRG